MSGKPDELSSWVFAWAPLSITTTSFCNYKLGCTHTHHQVGPGLKAQANRSHHLTTLNLFLCESYSTFFFFFLNTHLRCQSLQASQPVGINMLNFILKHWGVSLSYWCTIWVLLPLPSQSSGRKHLVADGIENEHENVKGTTYKFISLTKL